MHQDNLVIHERHWRNHWFVLNVLAEMPFIGGIFLQRDPWKALDIGLKYTAMIIGGTVTMTLPMDDNMNRSSVKTGGMMAVGMAGGAILYNGVRESTIKGYQLFSLYKGNNKNRKAEDESLTIELSRSDNVAPQM